uniref:Uncharacterized protein n=1 Tax=Physcomitrium patens TaxID=3218 RepID=A0A7I3Z3P5_PHYPA
MAIQNWNIWWSFVRGVTGGRPEPAGTTPRPVGRPLSRGGGGSWRVGVSAGRDLGASLGQSCIALHHPHAIAKIASVFSIRIIPLHVPCSFSPRIAHLTSARFRSYSCLESDFRLYFTSFDAMLRKLSC